RDPGAVWDVDPELGREEPVGGALPVARQPVLRMLAIVLDVDAVLAVGHHAAARGQEGEDRVVGDREAAARVGYEQPLGAGDRERRGAAGDVGDRKSTRLNSSHSQISYAVFCLKKKKKKKDNKYE